MAKAKSIIIIPARGGSKRLPGKNLKLLSGKPLIEYSLNYARANSDDNTEIVVTTNDEDIKNFVLKKGIEVIDRPEAISKDDSTTVSALKHVLETMGESYEYVILLQPTNPFRPNTLLNETVGVFKNGNYDSLMTVSLNDKKLGKIKDDRFIPYTYKMGQRSQDLEPLYFENGLLYISKTELILNNQILGHKNYPFIVNHPFASVDIDTQEDLNYAEFVAKTYSDE
ncbi:acylneuraminate cytidylyltransferase family protein [Winogradskyella alexanderae]|uniref:Acylneuraminate cytidylyltransferase family protein n=1 Tax=Winogradskyella alexanderae TaxID=2877123 RepID=A0ABS7XPN5_9FLAO|nr:acylneuraminate cytidylyltransferase family protein [Winogradskyella alexanderae]MCA0131972.1 acylneuraminate cytidylyltransferase family protein [Winogradskyella alexanderae]